MFEYKKWESWEKRWVVDLESGSVRHESGFTIQFVHTDNTDLPGYDGMISVFPNEVNRQAVFDPNWFARLIKQAHEMYNVALRRQQTNSGEKIKLTG